MAFTRKFKHFFAILCLLAWTHIDICVVYAAAYQSSSLKTSPSSFHEESPGTDMEQEVGKLFDHNLSTSYAPSGTALVDVNLDRTRMISEIRVYGPSSYILTIQKQINGQWQDIETFKNLNLSALSDKWHRFESEEPAEADALRLQLVPSNPSNDTGDIVGIQEIEFWSPGEHEPVQSGNVLLALMDSGFEIEQGRQYRAEPGMGVIGPDEGEYIDHDNDNVFRFDLAYQPAQIKRAYLSYDLEGLAHWTSAIRSINDQAAMGGYVIERGEGGPQTEAVSPGWLRQGTNFIRFVPVSDDETYVIRDVQVLIELDNGANFVSRVRSNLSRKKSDIAGLYDGNVSTGLNTAEVQEVMLTGWERRSGQQQTLDSPDTEGLAELEFDRTTDLTSLGFYTTGKLETRIRVVINKNGEWLESTATADHKLNKEGWYYLNIPDGEDAQAVRLVFDNTSGNAEISEIRAAGSNMGSGDVPVISISYPDAGQYFGDSVYIRGFVTPDNGSGQVRLFAGDQEIIHVNGEFETIADAETADENRELELTAVYPDGETVMSLIPLLADRLDQINDQIEVREYQNQPNDEDTGDSSSLSDEIYNDVNLTEDFQVVPGKDHKLNSNGAKVEMGKGAVRNGMKIRMMTLRDRDLPALDSGMVNVTGKFRGFRFLPHGMKFDKKVKVKLPYNKHLIPEGFKDDDVRTYFFDEASGRWIALERESVDKTGTEVVSNTDHFTDMINAVVQVPESPQKTSFNPTQIKDIKVANPGAKVNTIEPPQANNQGDARLSYPIEIPPGRKGMQPQLGVQYSSGGGNGWMGLGWDLSMQAVSIDTRWGVPRYSDDKETETYTLNGQQLTPLAHRTALVSRTSEKIFHTRVEGGFQKIIRHGDHPADYWWEVTDKNGTRYFYGGDPDNGPSGDSILTDYDGNVAKWALHKMQDSNGNTIEYQYVRQQDNGVSGGSVPGYDLYLTDIYYTGHENETGPYQVTFTRDRQLGEAKRNDVTIDCRLGFKKVTADLLRKVEVRYNGKLIRSYEFGYVEGAFKKTLLKTITQFDNQGKVFNSHEFEYFDEARNANGNYYGFGASENWKTGEGSDNAKVSGMIADGDASAIGGSKSDSIGGHLFVGIGVSPKKETAVGGKVGHSRSNNRGILAFTDINGDGLPDKVFGSGSIFRPNLSGPGGVTTFGAPVSINLGDISREKSSMTSKGAEAYFGGCVGINHSKTFSEATTYLSDVNGDGITDLVKNGAVRFGYPDNPDKTRPVPNYNPNSSKTPYPVGGGAVDGENLLENFEQLYEEMTDDNPLHDTLRRWVAPYSGQIAISGDVALIEDESSERSEYKTADGVKVAVQHNGSELWTSATEADDYSPLTPEGLDVISVQKGDRIYFRVQSRFDGAYDQVSWDPKIEYLNTDPEAVDANGLNPYVYQAGNDFIPTGRRNLFVTLPVTGSVLLSGDVEKLDRTSDDIRVVVLLNDEEMFSQVSGYDEIGTIPVSLNLNVSREDQLKLKIEADSPVDLTQIQWKPHLEYTSAENVDSVYDPQGNPVLVFDPPYIADVYGDNNLNAPHEMWTAPKSGDLDVRTSFVTGSDKGVLVLTVKRVNDLAGKAVFDLAEEIRKGSVIKINGVYRLDFSLTVTVNQDDQLFFSLSTRDRLFAQDIRSYGISARYRGDNTGKDKDTIDDSGSNDDNTDSHADATGNGKDNIGDGATNDDAYSNPYGSPSGNVAIAVPKALYFPAEETFFAQPYRGWTFAGYNGNRERADQPIIESDLRAPSFDRGRFDRNRQTKNADELDPQSSPEKAKGIMFYPDPKNDRWRGYDDGTWLTGSVQSSSRLSMDYIAVPKSGAYAGASAVSRLSRNTQLGVFGGGGPASGSYTTGESRTILDFMDMNGDRFPDVVSESSIQYSPMTGGLEGSAKPVNYGIRESGTKAWSVGISGTFAHNKGKQTGLQMDPLGVSGNFGKSDDESDYDFADINGDGLPDKVYNSGNVALNLGYKFAGQENWGTFRLSKGESMNLSLGASLGFNDFYYGFGGGVSLSQSKHEAERGWADINGDGLTDYVQVSGGTLGVALNTGNGFAGMTYPGAGDFSKNVSINQGGGAYFTIGILITPVPTPIFLIINPGADFSMGVGRPERAIMDIDGDGYADYLTSEKHDSVKVRRNRIGRTNLLKSVKRPLGASFSIEYERDGNTYQLPQSRWNMTRVEVHDGFAGDGVDKLVSTYSYENGFHHRREREFFGYETVKTEQRNSTDNDSVYRGTVQTFMNRNYYEKGLLVSEIVKNGQGNKYLETTNSYQLRDVDAGTILQGDFKDSLTATVFPELARTDKKFYEGQTDPGISTYQTFEYGEFGNVVHFFDAADPGADDDVESFIEYHKDLAHYIVGKAKKIVVKGNGKLMRQREADFQSGTGNLTQVRISLGSGTAVHDMGYDKYGNIVSQTGASNKKGQRYALSYAYDPHVSTYVKKIQDSFGYVSRADYDLHWGEIKNTTDINNQVISYVYDSVGRVTGITGPYQQGKGRETIAFAYHPEAVVPWALTQHYDNYQQQGDPLETVLFIDGLKREIQTKKDGEISTGNANTRDVMIVSGRVIFDFVGRAVEQYYPITEPLGRQGNFNAGFDSVQPTRTSHDVMDRVLETVMPDNTSIRYAYGFGTDRNGKTRFQTKVTDANQKSKVSYKDVQELITSVQEFNKGKTIWTSYNYDPMRQIVAVKDNKNNITSVQYDIGGRRTHIDSPDARLTEYVFDAASNVVKKITANLKAKGKAVEYDYTYNRLDKILYPDYTENNVTYTYGAPGAAFNRADRIVTVADESGKEERFYGPLGETVKTIKYVSSETEGNSANSPEIYITEYTYDTYNRLRQLIYPDAEVLTYSYNSGGLAESVSGKKGDYTYQYLKALTYDKFEQRVYMKQGNNAETNYTYNPLNRRLSTLKAKSRGRQFMDLSYGYDFVGNILKLDNWAKVKNPTEFGGETHYSYGYDDLYRLTSSSGNLKQKPNTEHKYTLSMQYDSIHNIVSKNQNHVRITPGGSSIEQKKTSYDYSYAYGSSRPHAPTHIGDRTFSYDANGNQSGWESDKNGTRRKISWDEENRIQVIQDNGHTMTYKYNDAGERVFKTGPQGETCYVNQFYSVRNREVGSKHVFVGTGMIVTKLVKKQENVTTPASATDHPGNSDPSGNAYGHDKDNNAGGNSTGNNGGGSGGCSPGNGVILYEPDLFYYHPNHLGSTSFVTDVEGELYQHIEYFPSGETWVEEVSDQHRVSYLFTAKELDRETGLYYFGARYYDPRTSVWQSCDPILGIYLDGTPNYGVHNPFNLACYSYSYHNPIIFLDPDGNFSIYLHTQGTGHVGVQTNKNGALKNYDFGRYHGRYNNHPYTGPNILKTTKGNPDSLNKQGGKKYEFKVSAKLDNIIAGKFAEKFNNGQKDIPQELKAKMGNKSGLKSNERYMGSDWGINGPNCVTSSLGTLQESLDDIINGKYSDDLIKEAKGVKNEIGKLDNLIFPTAPSDVKNRLEKNQRFQQQPKVPPIPMRKPKVTE